MSNPLHILLVDDNPDDRLLAIRELRRKSPHLQVKQIIEAQGFAQALEAGDFDLVITDYQLRWSDGLAVLRATKARCPHCPVIMFTATGSEQIAVQAMKNGLDDYVLKSPQHLARLPAAVRSALERAQERQALKEAETRYRNLFERVPVGLYRTALGGQIIDANPVLVQMLGYPDRETLLAINVVDLYVDPQDRRREQVLMERDGVVRDFEMQLCRHDGTVIWVQDSSRAILDDERRVLYYEGALEDITERQRAEEERERLILELQEALARVKMLSGLLPICASCKKIRDDKGYWHQVEVYVRDHSEAEFSHGLCPDCAKKLYPEYYEDD